MSWEEILAIAQAEVRATVAAMPARLQQEARHVPVIFKHRPSRAMQADGIEPDTLGLFLGDSLPETDPDPQPMPVQVLLFLDNLWDLAEGDETKFRKEIRVTLLHELGHYLGLDEVDLERRGLD